MLNTDPRIDAYIEKAEPFARPVMIHLRDLIHKACPEVKETIKWGFASFDYKGPFCSMASFKKHCVFGFWKYVLLEDPNGILDERSNRGGEAMGNLGRITGIEDLPDDEIILDFILQAKKLNDLGIKVPPPPPKPKAELVIPDDLLDALRENEMALEKFEKLSNSHKREYVEWLDEAKTEPTRQKRITTTVEWCSEGKARNWKYERKK